MDIDDFPWPCKTPCELKYTIEPHGDGLTLYWGRCNCRHGYNLAQVSEVSANALEILNGDTAVHDRDVQ